MPQTKNTKAIESGTFASHNIYPERNLWVLKIRFFTFVTQNSHLKKCRKNTEHSLLGLVLQTAYRMILNAEYSLLLIRVISTAPRANAIKSWTIRFLQNRYQSHWTFASVDSSYFMLERETIATIIPFMSKKYRSQRDCHQFLKHSLSLIWVSILTVVFLTALLISLKQL